MELCTLTEEVMVTILLTACSKLVKTFIFSGILAIYKGALEHWAALEQFSPLGDDR